LASSVPKRGDHLREGSVERKFSRWHESLFGVDFLLLLASPVYYGVGVPRGDGSGVVMIPGFMHSDAYLLVMYAWLRRLGYRPYYSGISLNAECPNLLIQHELNDTVTRARAETGQKIHLIGHSLGGVIARSFAAQRPDDIASFISLGAPFRNTVPHPSLLRETELVRTYVLMTRGQKVLPSCYTGECECDFVKSLRRPMPSRVAQTVIYTRNDGAVDWRCCITGDSKIDVEVPGTHTGLVFNPTVYSIIAKRLASRS
jgi:triacylglycerol lipase